MKKEIPIHHRGVHALTLTVEAVVTAPIKQLRDDVNAEVTQLMSAKRHSDAVALLRNLVENHPSEANLHDKVRMADLMQQAGDYEGAVLVFQAAIDDATIQEDELKRLVQDVIPALRRWRSAAKRQGVKDDVTKCDELLHQADERLPFARAAATKKRIQKMLAVPLLSFDHIGWSASSSIDEACTRLHLQAWRIPSQEFLEIAEQHFSSPPNECRCTCMLISDIDRGRRPWKFNQVSPDMRY